MALEYFTLAEIRALPQMSDASKYTDARIEAASAYVVAIFERFTKTSFIYRSHTETHDGIRANETGLGLVLRQRFPRAITAVTQDGAAFSVDDLAELTIDRGVLWRASVGTYSPMAWNVGRRNISVTYTAGYSTTPPADIVEAALQATRWRLIATNSNSDLTARQTSVSNEIGGTTVYAVAGEERPTGYPEVDAVLQGYRKQRGPLVF